MHEELISMLKEG